MSPSKKKRREAWMRDFQEACAKLGAFVGGDDWNTAHYLFDEGHPPSQAADLYASTLRGMP